MKAYRESLTRAQHYFAVYRLLSACEDGYYHNINGIPKTADDLDLQRKFLLGHSVFHTPLVRCVNGVPIRPENTGHIEVLMWAIEADLFYPRRQIADIGRQPSFLMEHPNQHMNKTSIYSPSCEKPATWEQVPDSENSVAYILADIEQVIHRIIKDQEAHPYKTRLDFGWFNKMRSMLQSENHSTSLPNVICENDAVDMDLSVDSHDKVSQGVEHTKKVVEDKAFGCEYQNFTNPLLVRLCAKLSRDIHHKKILSEFVRNDSRQQAIIEANIKLHNASSDSAMDALIQDLNDKMDKLELERLNASHMNDEAGQTNITYSNPQTRRTVFDESPEDNSNPLSTPSITSADPGNIIPLHLSLHHGHLHKHSAKQLAVVSGNDDNWRESRLQEREFPVIGQPATPALMQIASAAQLVEDVFGEQNVEN